ncbi:UNVERIFIED_CONTAM: HAD-IA family hydrolase [Methylobacteriaceae bacterium AG10]|nr:HAD-IA family hydrolase [Methylobacteriaceae bacterium AG10]
MPPSPDAVSRALRAVIFDVDGVLVDSPHEQAWREALAAFADPTGFTTAFYQAHVAGKPRLEGARATLERLGGTGAASDAAAFGRKKQAVIDRLIAEDCFTAFPDAIRLAVALRQTALRTVLASSSKNADAMLARVILADGRTLLSLFDADVSGRDLPRGKPDPALFRLAAGAVEVPPAACLVVEDAPAGIRAAKAGGMAGLGIARLGDAALLRAAGADLVLTSLDDLDVSALSDGVLQRRSGPDPHTSSA